MLKSSIERVARTRYVIPIVLAVAVITIAVNESTYQHSRNSLESGITLTDARLQALRTLQALTDAETAARAYLINGQEVYRTDYREAIEALNVAQQGAFQYIADADPRRTVSVGAVRQRIQNRVTALEEWMTTTERGQRTRAHVLASSDRSRQAYVELRQEFDHVLDRAAAVQQSARLSLFDAMMLNRLALHVLVLVAVMALLMFMRQLREIDERKARESQVLELEIAVRTAELRELAGHLVNTREDERGRVARELHDEMGGLLTAMKLEMARLRRVPDLPAAARERMGGIEKRLNEGIAVKRRIVENLRPSSLEQLGLIAALEVLCQDVSSSLGIPVLPQLEAVELDRDAELTVYRVVQESLTNISKYAHARHAWVSLKRQEGQARLLVRDDGQGFDLAQVPTGHHGLLGMRVRVESHAGKLTITSAPGQGTRVAMELPLAASPTPPAQEPQDPIAQTGASPTA
ncbi:MAG: ATP-binding protein [Hydrogenophaga sp.]|uniref:sensor histidine kinase n=1 Tax=Hydrogenophaga sp. TaxID=1904254 RepID=UPI003D14D3CB